MTTAISIVADLIDGEMYIDSNYIIRR